MGYFKVSPNKEKLDMVQQKQDWATKLNEVESLISDLEVGRTYTVQPMHIERLFDGKTYGVVVYVSELGEFRTFPIRYFAKFHFTLGEKLWNKKFHVVASKKEANGRIVKSWKVELA